MSMFTLAISFDHFQFALIHGPDIPGSYAILLFTASDLASITSHIQKWVLFLLWLHPFVLSVVFLHWSPVAYWAPNDLGSSSFGILSYCLFILFMGFSRQEYWSGLPFPSPVDHVLSDLSTMTHPSWVAPQAWLGFIELDKAVVLVWLDWLVFCEYGSVCLPSDALLQHLPSYLGFSYLGCGGISSRLLQQCTAAAPYLGQGVSPYHCRSWSSMWDSSSRPSCACATTAPRVAPPGCGPWPHVWIALSSCCP